MISKDGAQKPGGGCIIMLEIIVGVLALFLGWLWFDHVSRVRALYSEERPRHSRFHEKKPLMIIPSALGVLFVLDGLALLTLAAVERLHGANMAGSVGMTAALAQRFIPLSSPAPLINLLSIIQRLTFAEHERLPLTVL
jgi:hypothetical protein